MKTVIIFAIFGILASQVSQADDPGARDTIFMETVYAEIGDTSVDVNAYVFCDDSIAFYNFPLTCNSICDSASIYLTQVTYHNTLILWDECWDLLACDVNLLRMLGWSDICGDDNPLLYNPYDRLLCWTFHFSIDSLAVPQAVVIDTAYDSVNGSLLFGEYWGINAFTPEFVPGVIFYGVTSGAYNGEVEIPTEMTLMGNYPNPFNPTTTLIYALPEPGHISISIYNILGQKAATLFEGEKPAGRFTLQWDGSRYPSGIYFARLETGDISKSIKMVLLK